MTQKVSRERVTKLLNLESILTKHERLVYYDPFCRSYQVAENFDFTDSAWTGPLLEKLNNKCTEVGVVGFVVMNGKDSFLEITRTVERTITKREYIHNLILRRPLYIANHPEGWTGIQALNTAIIAALDALDKEK